jgi:hypothetical protein
MSQSKSHQPAPLIASIALLPQFFGSQIKNTIIPLPCTLYMDTYIQYTYVHMYMFLCNYLYYYKYIYISYIIYYIGGEVAQW